MIPYDEITKLVGIIVSMREPFDHHGSGVARLAVKMAQAMNLPASDAALMKHGAHLHDIGKLLVDRNVLNASRKLTDEEMARMQMHTTLGWEIVHQADYDQMILDIVRSHHEHMNGSGYPDGLIGDQIPMAARAIAICDAYDALTSKRAYRDAFSHQFAMAFIQKDKRTLFDAELVDLFFEKVADG